jgi:predicted DNA-binding ArsR family transcriptional regulator
VLRRIFVPQRYEMTAGQRTLLNEELQNWYTLQGINRIIGSRSMRLAEHAA